ncbi:MAG: type I restriction enzyme HsdR N-terminal domain-containing protein [Pirellulales bacterium]
MSTDEVLGVATCTTCLKRFRISKKYERFIGKTISCPKCTRPFVIQLEAVSPIEQAAIASSPQSSNGKASGNAATESARKRRTKTEVRKAAYKQIRKGFGPCMKQLQAMSESETLSEERIRLWCVDVLRTALGYKDADLDYEVSATNKKIDIAVKHDNDVIMVIECKKRETLKEVDRQQALNYAMSRSASWAVVTNGRTWELLRVIPVKGQNPECVSVFSIALLDEDGLSPYDVERMYLLTKKSLLRGETETEFHLAQCFDKNRLVSAMFTDRVVSGIRRSLIDAYKKEFKQRVKITDDDVYEELRSLIRPDEL